MANIDLAANRQASQQKPLVSIYWDYQNIPDAKLAKYLSRFAELQGYVTTKKVCNNWDIANKTDKATVESNGFECINESRKSKNAVDFKVVIHCSGEASRSAYSHIFIIVSGDSYSEILIEELQKQGKKVIIFARKGSVNEKKLKELANEFHFVDELPKLVEEKTQPQTDSASSHISYNEAINYLIEAIKTAIKEGKRAGFSLIGKLMRKICSQYRGVEFIRTADGKKFSKFKEFVEAVANEGKVRIQNEELFLIEECQLAK